jgi:hypothetical protein
VDGAFCLPCVLFATGNQVNRDAQLIGCPFQNWVKYNNVVSKHQEKRYHIDACVAFDDFVKRMQNPSVNISSQIDHQMRENIARNRKVMTSIAETVHFLGKQGLSFRGHRDDAKDDTPINKGNFKALLEFRANAGDKIIGEHLENCHQNARYDSKTIQNHMIELIGDEIRQRYVREVSEAKYFTILADEVTDLSNKEQLSLILRFVDAKSCIREEFVDFIELERITGQKIADAIIGKLDHYGLDLKYCRGQGYDGASNMSADQRGAQGIIMKDNPKALYMHCNSHILNLVKIGEVCTVD